MWRKTSILTKSVIVILAIAMIAGCSGGEQAPVEETPEAFDFTPIVSATGVVTPETWSTISIKTAGIIEEVLVEEGDLVEVDQLLIQLKGDEDIQALVTAARLELISAQQALDALYDNADIYLANSFRAVNEANNEVRDARYQLDNFIVSTRLSGYSALQAVEETRKKLDAAQAEYEPFKYKSELNKTREDLKEKLDDAQAEYDEAVRWLTYELRVQEAEARLKKALEDYEVLKDGPDPDDIALAEARLANAQASVASAEAKLADLQVKALFAGTIGDIYVRVGEWVSPGQPILVLADLSRLRVETTDLNEIDVARVRVDDPVDVTFDALPDVAVGGKVRMIAPKASEGSGVNYTVIIDLDEIPEALKWGMTAFVDIEVSD
ncbi:MAG: efflux RND transporter periplasmic adaptor subunit [Anaerolineales bacterium]|nr:efflux RND transporter periplasmic adaptor subunit [Anaerolineales bacterium]